MRTTSKQFEEQYKKLNKEQQAAVDTIDGPLMVLAGPGTGKTQVLAMRVANILLKTPMDPYNILCLTFTEAAAAAMRKRLLTIIGEAAYYVRIQTFHSFCNDIIQDHPEQFAFTRALAVLSAVERIQIFKKILDDLPASSLLKPFGNPYFYLSDVIGTVGVLKQENITPQVYSDLLAIAQRFSVSAAPALEAFFALTPKERTEGVCDEIRQKLATLYAGTDPVVATIQAHLTDVFTQYDALLQAADDKRQQQMARTKLKNELKQWFTKLQQYQPHQAELHDIYEAYQAQLRERGRYDYEDMIAFVVQAFRTNDQLLAFYQERLQYILVDEFQDTNGSQDEVIRLLGSYHDSPNVFVVGDDQQAIFRFQGASLENIVRFLSRYKQQMTIIILQNNYRSPQSILDAADGVIVRNDTTALQSLAGPRLALLAAARPGRPPVQEHVFGNESAEEFWVAGQIQRLVEEGASPSDIAVLYRYHSDAAGVAAALRSFAVPLRIEGGEDIFNQRRIQQFMTLLTYIHDPSRSDLLAQLLQFDFLQLPALPALQIIHQAGHGQTPLLDLLTTSTVPAFAELPVKLGRWRQLAGHEALANFLAIVAQESGLLDSMIADPQATALLRYLSVFFNEVKKLSFEQSALTLSQLLEHLQTLQEYGISLEAAAPLGSTGAVRLMTAHRAKGLEFDHVFVIHLTDGQWGNGKARRGLPLPPGVVGRDRLQQNNNEDERRLFYVAMTRAKQQLYLSYATQAGSGKEQLPSLFLQEVPADHMSVTTHEEDPAQATLRMATLLRPAPLATTDEHKVWLTELLENYALSVTALNNYLECPRLFYYHNLLRVPLPRSKALSFGTAVHDALRDLFEAWSPKTPLPPVEFLLKRFAHHAAHELFSEVDRRDSLVIGEKALRGYYQQYHDQFVPTQLLEYNFGPQRIQLDGIRLNGKIDKIEVIDPATKSVNVVDYKTGNPDTGYKKLGPGGSYRRQLVFYKLLTELAPRFPYTMTTGELDFIQPSPKTKKYIKKKFSITTEEVAALKEQIKITWKEIQNLEFLNPDNPQFCGECEYCTK